MRATVITRSGPVDYGYLGAPGDEWWSAASRFTDLNDAEVIVWRSPDGMRVLVSGIPSARRDSSNRAIRVTLVLAGDDRPTALRALVRMSLSEEGRTELGKRLDTVITEDVVTELLHQADADAMWLGTEVLDVLDAVPSEGSEPVDEPGSWVGPAEDDEAQAAFLGRLDAMIDGTAAGYLIATHELVSLRGAQDAMDALDDQVAFLLHDTAVSVVTPLGKAEAPGWHPARSTALTVVVAVAMTVVALVIYLLLRRFGSK